MSDASAASRRENFWVLSPVLPRDLRHDFAAVYAFCRAADDIADEHGHTEASKRHALDQLATLRVHLDDPATDHPIVAPLHDLVARRGLRTEDFADLLTAFEQDQQVSSYETWDDLIGYCRYSADPVGRIVLGLGGITQPNAEVLKRSNAVCTALQLVNHLQDLGRDLIGGGRVYMPSDLTGLNPADWTELRSAGPSAQNVDIAAEALRPVLNRTNDLVRTGLELPPMLEGSAARLRPTIWLFAQAADAMHDLLAANLGTSLWQRPRLPKSKRLSLLARACFVPRSGTARASIRAIGVAA